MQGQWHRVPWWLSVLIYLFITIIIIIVIIIMCSFAEQLRTLWLDMYKNYVWGILKHTPKQVLTSMTLPLYVVLKILAQMSWLF